MQIARHYISFILFLPWKTKGRTNWEWRETKKRSMQKTDQSERVERWMKRASETDSWIKGIERNEENSEMDRRENKRWSQVQT